MKVPVFPSLTGKAYFVPWGCVKLTKPNNSIKVQETMESVLIMQYEKYLLHGEPQNFSSLLSTVYYL